MERPIYRETALGICDFVLSVQSPEGRIGKSWKNDGTPDDPEGTVGCFLVPPLVKAYELTGIEAYLHGAELGYRYYIRELQDNGYTTAGALDTYCVDKESAIPLLKAGLACSESPARRRISNGRSMPPGIWQHGSGIIPLDMTQGPDWKQSGTIRSAARRYLRNTIILIRLRCLLSRTGLSWLRSPATRHGEKEPLPYGRMRRSASRTAA